MSMKENEGYQVLPTVCRVCKRLSSSTNNHADFLAHNQDTIAKDVLKLMIAVCKKEDRKNKAQAPTHMYVCMYRT